MNEVEHKGGYSSIENMIIDEGNENNTTDPDPDVAHVSMAKYEKTKLEIDPVAAENHGQPSGQFDRKPPDSEMTTIPTTVSNPFISQHEHSPQVDESENPIISAPSFKKEIKQETDPFSPAITILVSSKDTKSVNALSNKETSWYCPFYKQPSNDCYLCYHKNAVDIPPSTNGRKYWVTPKIQNNYTSPPVQPILKDRTFKKSSVDPIN